ncbi:MAG: M14 family zinc carboxypeptidase, partial [Dehalococcoidia bacterium]|nr:M14 family zinc carboxypeptidase [Dehalococcoidia bacterium]
MNSTRDNAARETYGPPMWPPLKKLGAVLDRWQREYPEAVKVSAPGESVQGRPVWAVRLTDPTVDDENKEHVLITALHSGVERSATMTIFHLMEWLLSGEPLTREILRRQARVCMPVPNPDGYLEEKHDGCLLKDWTLEGPKEPDKLPEAAAVQKIMDEYQPELYADIHGISMDFERYIMAETSCWSYFPGGGPCYHREIIRLMDEAALAEGYPSDLQESDSEHLFLGTWTGRPIHAPTYCYNLYHTILVPSEVAWERSGLLRHRRLLQIGNETWPSEYYPGYPTRVIMRKYHVVTAYGQTAAARRRSRVELWSKQGQITHGMNDPIVEGKILYVCATSPNATEKWLGDPTFEALAPKLAQHPRMNSGPIARFMEGWPRGDNCPEAFVALRKGGVKGRDEVRLEEATPIEHGLS